MTGRTVYIVFILFAFCNLACKKGNPFGNEGKMVKVLRPAASIGQVILNDNINLILTQDSIEKISVEAPEKIEPYITTEFVGQSLTIKNKNAALLQNPNEIINVYVSVKNLGRLDYHGSGNISCTNTLQKDYFNIESTDGSGNVNLDLNTILTIALLDNDVADFNFRGASDSCYTYCSSIGTIDYRNFKVKRLAINSSSVRDAYVWATEALHGQLFFKGNIYYKGNPPVLNTQATHNGRFIPF
jgi:hypothetical protein